MYVCVYLFIWVLLCYILSHIVTVNAYTRGQIDRFLQCCFTRMPRHKHKTTHTHIYIFLYMKCYIGRYSINLYMCVTYLFKC